VPFLVVLVVAVVVVVLVMRAANAPGRTGSAAAPRPSRPPRRAPGAGRPIAPDDDPEFIAELERRARRDDGSKNA
jgi:cell division protein FtsN